MRVLVVHAHPEPKSMNGALFRTAVETLRAEGHEVLVSDLYAEGFDPVSDRRNFVTVADAETFKQQVEEMHASRSDGFAPSLEAEMRKVEACDLMVWQFPLWWFGLPAILKGWADRVLAMGRFYGGGRVYATGPCRGKRAVLSLTTGGPEAAYLPEGFNGDLAGILRPIQRGILEFVGFDVLAPHVVYGPARASDDDRHRALASWADRLRGIASESPIVVGRY